MIFGSDHSYYVCSVTAVSITAGGLSVRLLQPLADIAEDRPRRRPAVPRAVKPRFAASNSDGARHCHQAQSLVDCYPGRARQAVVRDSGLLCLATFGCDPSLAHRQWTYHPRIQRANPGQRHKEHRPRRRAPSLRQNRSTATTARLRLARGKPDGGGDGPATGCRPGPAPKASSTRPRMLEATVETPLV